MTVSGKLSTGESVTLRAFDGNAIEVVTQRAFAPGARAVMVLEIASEALGIEVKCHGSRKLEDGRFSVRGRVISMRREDRENLIAALAAD